MKKNGNGHAPAPPAPAPAPMLPVRLKAEDADVARGLGMQYEQAVHAYGAFCLKRENVEAQIAAEAQRHQGVLSELAKRVQSEVESLRQRYHIEGDGWHFDYMVGAFTRPTVADPPVPLSAPAGPEARP